MILVTLFFFGLCVYSVLSVTERSPYYQWLPDCEDPKQARPFVRKLTNSKGIVCPMVKDEEGFLSEWTAFYEMQGFDHIIFYDNNSTSSFAELDPWVASGFVTIKRDWWGDDQITINAQASKKRSYHQMMRLKMLAEVDCKRSAVAMGIEIFASVDMDEYLMPSDPNKLVIDELKEWFDKTTRGVAIISKFNFPPTPHILEPIHLLTIEAYQTRYPFEDKMNYYSRVNQKVALRLFGGGDYDSNTTLMIINCCDFHGCGNYKFNKTCPDLIYSETGKVLGKHRPWKPILKSHHYARSLEKFLLKQKTWETASAEDSGGYHIHHYLDRVHGWEYDNNALKWNCQLRSLLYNRTGIKNYVRAGDSWYRNLEYGRTVEDPKKRGRFGGGYGKRVGPREMNPYPPQDVYQRAHKAYDPNEVKTIIETKETPMGATSQRFADKMQRLIAGNK